MKKYVLEIGEKEYTAEVKELTTEYAKVDIDGSEYHVKLKELGRKMGALPTIESVKPVTPAGSVSAAPTQSKAAKPAAPAGADEENVKAPLPGLILEVKVNVGDKVKSGQNLLVMEAMKMENLVQAPHDGRIDKIFVNKGDSVAEGDLLTQISRSFISSL
jgi:glutaconyl-CoA/methylmalonyl-CoA decarboxylase subunit gamma